MPAGAPSGDGRALTSFLEPAAIGGFGGLPANKMLEANIAAVDSQLELLREVIANKSLPIEKRIKLSQDITDKLAEWTVLRGSDRNATYDLVARHVQQCLARESGGKPFSAGNGVPTEFILEEADRIKAKRAAEAKK